MQNIVGKRIVMGVLRSPACPMGGGLTKVQRPYKRAGRLWSRERIGLETHPSMKYDKRGISSMARGEAQK